MRIGLVCPYDLTEPGGVQEQVRGLQRTLQYMGDDAVILAPGAGQGEDVVDLGSSVSIPGNRSVVPISVDPLVVRRIRAAASGFDLLHVHEPLMPTVSFSALRAGLPVVATFHAAPGPMGSRFYRVIASQMRRILGPNVRAVTAVSRTAAVPLPETLQVAIVPNGLDVDSFDRDGHPVAGRVCFLGRDEPRKGLDVLLEAWHQVESELPDAELVVMGAARDVTGIEWLGRVAGDRKVEVLSSSAVYVAPHLGRESFGIVLVEAMAAGAAVLASDLESFRDVAGSAAAYFSPGDSEALAAQLVNLLSDDDMRAKMRDAGRVRARRFDWDTVAASYRGIYQVVTS